MEDHNSEFLITEVDVEVKKEEPPKFKITRSYDYNPKSNKKEAFLRFRTLQNALQIFGHYQWISNEDFSVKNSICCKGDCNTIIFLKIVSKLGRR